MKKSFKAVLCIFLCFALLLPAVGSLAGTQPPLTVWVVSDIHYRPQSDLGPVNEQEAIPGETLFNHVNYKGELLYESKAIIMEFLQRFENSSAEILLIPGDLTEDGYWSEHLAIAEILREFKNRTGKKIYLVPGNHDIRTSASNNRLDPEDFTELYREFGYDQALVRHDYSFSYTIDLDSSYRLLALDSVIYQVNGGRLSEDLLSWIDVQASRAKTDGKKLLAMVHHNVLDHFGVQSFAGNSMCLENYREIATKFADLGIKCVLTGHQHANDITMAVSAKGNRIYDIETGSLISYPNAYREISFSPDAVEVRTSYVDKIDFAYLGEGFNEEKLNYMRDDFPGYSREFFNAGMASVAYIMPDLIGYVAGALNVEEGTTAYNALCDFLVLAKETMKLPLYDKAGTPEVDSVEEIAAEGGVTLERSDYKTIPELFGALYGNHMAGDETIPDDTLEVVLFKQCLKGNLIYLFSNLPSATVNSVLESFSLPALNIPADRTLTKMAKLAYAKTAANLVLTEIIRPLLRSITVDTYAPGDLNETLEPYGTNWDLPGKTAAITDHNYAKRILLVLIRIVLNSIKSIILA